MRARSSCGAPTEQASGALLSPPPSPRSVALRVEIGPLPHRDRSYSAPRSVATRLEIGRTPHRNRSSSTSRMWCVRTSETIWCLGCGDSGGAASGLVGVVEISWVRRRAIAAFDCDGPEPLLRSAAGPDIMTSTRAPERACSATLYRPERPPGGAAAPGWHMGTRALSLARNCLSA